jgi:hypothetical protein
MKKYCPLELEVIEFDGEDVITTSGGGSGPTTLDEEDPFDNQNSNTP